MRRIFIIISIFFCSLAVAAQQSSDWQTVENVFGRKGTLQDDVFKITFPRSDLKIKIGDIAIDSGLAPTSWMAFKQVGNQAIAMGDLVLLDQEIAPAISKLIVNGIEITGIHNHLLGESPGIKYIHFSGKGESVKLAKAMKTVLSSTGTPMDMLPSPPTTGGSDWSKVEATLGHTGQHKGNLLQLSLPRAEKIMENGMEIPPVMGTGIVINFQMTGKTAAATGDFVLTAGEVNLVIKALSEHGITVTALHNHMLTESPRLFFLHFWGTGEPEKLAAGLKAGLDKINIAKKS